MKYLSLDERYKLVQVGDTKGKEIYEVVSMFPGISKTEAKRLIKQGGVSVGRLNLTMVSIGKHKRILII